METQNDVIETKICQMCKKSIEASKFRMHEMGCFRQNYWCFKCDSCVPKAEKDQHEATECGKLVKDVEKDIPVAEEICDAYKLQKQEEEELKKQQQNQFTTVNNHTFPTGSNQSSFQQQNHYQNDFNEQQNDNQPQLSEYEKMIFEQFKKENGEVNVQNIGQDGFQDDFQPDAQQMEQEAVRQADSMQYGQLIGGDSDLPQYEGPDFMGGMMQGLQMQRQPGQQFMMHGQQPDFNDPSEQNLGLQHQDSEALLAQAIAASLGQNVEEQENVGEEQESNDQNNMQPSSLMPSDSEAQLAQAIQASMAEGPHEASEFNLEDEDLELQKAIQASQQFN